MKSKRVVLAKRRVRTKRAASREVIPMVTSPEITLTAIGAVMLSAWSLRSPAA